MSSTRIINDPIHAHFSLPPLVTSVLDTPHVQRLRDLKQLGATYHVFPGASHNRFEHSLGVAHLSATFVDTLHANPPNRHSCASLFENTAHFRTCQSLVQIAGLVHDIGHGPFSHLFDSQFLPAVCREQRLAHAKWLRHEHRSVAMFEHLVDEYHIDLPREAIRAIGDLIHGDKSNASPLPAFLFDVVSNSSTGIDTDKFDYIARDVYNIGLQSCYGFDHKRLMNFAKVIDDSVCFHRKEIFNVYHLFHTRFQLHRTVYNHPTALAIDAMIADVLLEADHVFKIFDSIHDPEQFLLTTDSVLLLIERSKQPSLRKARELLRRLRTRKLYKLVEEALLPPGYTGTITEEDIINAASTSVTKQQIHVANITLNFGMRDQNPVDNVKFFNDWHDTVHVNIRTSNVSHVMPLQFEERIVRVYVKSDDAGIRNMVRAAFRMILRLRNIANASKPTIHRVHADGELGNADFAESLELRVAERVRPNGFPAH